MFEYVKGTLADKSPTSAVIEAAGVGYELVVPLSTFEELCQIGGQAKLFTHHYVREDIQRLYGFSSKTERELFRRLIAVSNIGPKTAISILSGMPAGEFMSCVNRGDVTRLRKIPGVGDKTAQRIIVELKGKLGIADAEQAPRPAGAGPSERDQAFDALVSLGYADRQVLAAMARVDGVIEEGAPVEEWIKKALQVI
jgi:holliday junction DNA helicase RuvA